MDLVSRCDKTFQNTKFSFSIDHILNVAGKRSDIDKVVADGGKLEWLNYTRYRPPKLPRQRKKEGIQRRKLGRNPRIPFSTSQVAFLEAKFLETPYLSSSDVTYLASNLKLSETRVKIWFQNRRAREKREKESRNKVDEIQIKNDAEISTEPQSSPEGLPLKNFPLDFNSPFGYSFKISKSANYLEIVTPLDLSDRQIVFRPK